jgi:hypothetical protein
MLKIDPHFFVFKKYKKMQRQIIQGVPYFTDKKNNLYTWDLEAEPQLIGTYNAESNSVTFAENHLSKLADRLQAWRVNQASRPRKSPGTASSGRRNTKKQQAAST